MMIMIGIFIVLYPKAQSALQRALVAVAVGGEVKISVNVWTVHRDTKKLAVVQRWPLVEVRLYIV